MVVLMQVDESGPKIEFGRDLGRIIVFAQNLERDFGLLLHLAELVEAVEHEPDHVIAAHAMGITAPADVQNAGIVILGEQIPGLGEKLFLTLRIIHASRSHVGPDSGGRIPAARRDYFCSQGIIERRLSPTCST